MKKTTLAISLGLSTLACVAGASDTVEIKLPFGTIFSEMDETGIAGVLKYQNQQIVLNSAYTPQAVVIWKNSALISLPTGGNGCPNLYSWITLDAQGLRATDPFGTCSEQVDVVEKSDEDILVSMGRLNGAGKAGFVFDGESIQETEVGLVSAGVSNPRNAKSWAGKSANAVAVAAEMEPALLEIIDWQTLELLRSASSISSNAMEPDGQWYAATGCMPHRCNEHRAGVAISTEDGSILVATWSKETGGQLFGNPKSPVPNKLRALLSGR